jgi:hypothetical protein
MKDTVLSIGCLLDRRRLPAGKLERFSGVCSRVVKVSRNRWAAAER